MDWDLYALTPVLLLAYRYRELASGVNITRGLLCSSSPQMASFCPEPRWGVLAVGAVLSLCTIITIAITHAYDIEAAMSLSNPHYNAVRLTLCVLYAGPAW